jgi:hypothetical protein
MEMPAARTVTKRKSRPLTGAWIEMIETIETIEMYVL